METHSYRFNWADKEPYLLLIETCFSENHSVDLLSFTPSSTMKSEVRAITIGELSQSVRSLNINDLDGVLTIRLTTRSDMLFYRLLPADSMPGVLILSVAKSPSMKSCLDMISECISEPDELDAEDPIAIIGGKKFNKTLLVLTLNLYPQRRWYYSPSSGKLIIIIPHQERAQAFVVTGSAFDKYRCPSFDFDGGFRGKGRLIKDLNQDFEHWKESRDTNVLMHHD